MRNQPRRPARAGSTVIASDDGLTIRVAVPEDAPILTSWWNDGRVMAHAGFPDGVNTNEDEVTELILRDSDNERRMILELHGRPIGETNYRTTEPGTAEVGIKICDFSKHERGYGTRYLTMLLTYLFDQAGYRLAVLDTKQENTRAQHVYEKIGFRRTSESAKAVFYEITASAFRQSRSCSRDWLGHL